MGLRTKLKAMLMCLVEGHEPFDTGDIAVPRLFQSKDKGNAYRDLKVCARCDVVYGQHGELTAEELAEEAKVEAFQNELHAKMEKAREELLKRIAQEKVAKDGNIALN